jgi:3-oxoadipate enol-lactonase
MPSRTVNGTTIYYEESGQGLPLVLLHGFPLDLRVWSHQRSELSDRFRVITPDLRGFGKSASIAPFTMEALADDVYALLHDLGALPCVIGGLSMGGYVALEFVRKHPSSVRGLLLIDTRAEGDSPEGKAGRDKMIELVRSKGTIAVAEQMMPKMLAPHEEQNRPSVVRELREIMNACPPLTIEHALMAMRDRRDHRGSLPSIAAPTLILVGEMDAITPPMAAEAMHEAIAGSQLAVIPGAGHMSPMEQPELVNRAIAQFLGSLK